MTLQEIRLGAGGLLGGFFDVSQMFHGYFLSISWFFLGLSEVFLRSFFDILLVIIWCFLYIFQEFLCMFMDVSLVFLAANFHLDVILTN